MIRALALSLALSLGMLLPTSAVAQDDAPPDGPDQEPPVAPVTYKIDTSKGFTYILVNKDPSTMAAGLSHDHAVRARAISGSFTWNDADPSACRLDVTVPVAQLAPDAPPVRKAAGLAGELSEGQRKDVKKNMLSKVQLHGDHYPFITFKSRGCAGSGDAFEVSGDLTLRGQSRPVILRGSLVAGPENFQLNGKLEIRASDFGFEPYSAMFGQLKNLDAMSLVVDLQGGAG